MRVWPVIARELRAQARSSFTYGLRVLGVAALLLAGIFFGLRHGFALGSGGEKLFSDMNITLFGAIWILTPLLAADCISREKREGTLGLLFLTPLKAGDIVLAKAGVHGWRALTLWLAVIPALMIPFLLGGVSGTSVVISVLMDFSSLGWALAAGLLASSFGKSWHRSLLFACCLALLFFLALIYLNGMAAINGVFLAGVTTGWAAEPTLFDSRCLTVGLFSALNPDIWWIQVTGRVAARKLWVYPVIEGAVAAGSLLALVAAVRIAAARLQRSWQERPVSRWQLWWERVMCTPVLWVSFFHRWLRRKLERNPIGWLEQRTWSGRLVTWGWFAVMVSTYTAVFQGTGYLRIFPAIQVLLAALLVLAMAVCAAGSFRRERESGVMELLLVSPMKEDQIIRGRLRGLWGQFLPGLVVLLLVWANADRLLPRGDAWVSWEGMQFVLVSFLTLPVVGLYFSLRRSNFLGAFVLTVLAGLLLPVALQRLVEFGVVMVLGEVDYPGWLNSLTFRLQLMLRSPWLAQLLQILAAMWLGRRLRRDLESRNFAFDRPVY